VNKEAIKTFSYRITQANRTELVVVTFDIGIQYIRDALGESDVEAFRENLRMAKRVVDELISSLDMSYDISRQLFDTYKVIERYLIKAGSGATDKDFHSDERNKLLETAANMMNKLRDAFYEVSKTDNSAPLMHNTQQVYAGLTYTGAGGASETYEDGVNRGFRV
jgi:flagellar protein FliS